MYASPIADRTDAADTDAVLSALADSTRREVLRLTRHAEWSAGDLATTFSHMSRPAVSQHLRVLVDAGLVTMRPDGRRRMYRANREALSPVSAFIDDMWSDRLDRLKHAAEAAQTTERP